MLKKTKYDILYKEAKAANKGTLKLIISAISVSVKLESDEYSEEEKELLLGDLLRKCLPLVKIISHIGYENSKDLKNLNENSLNDYLESKNISKEEFLKRIINKCNEYKKQLDL